MKYLKWSMSSVLSGMLIGFAGWGFLLTKVYTNHVLAALVFPLGLLFICILQLDLFTGKIGLVIRNKELPFSRMIIMLLGNMVGACLIGLACHAIMNGNEAFVTLSESVALAKANIDGINLIVILLKSILCGIMVYLAVFLFKNANSEFGKVIGVFAPIFIFVLLGFDHCIANMFYISANHTFTWQAFVALLISILGNSLGALGFHYMLKVSTIKLEK